MRPSQVAALFLSKLRGLEEDYRRRLLELGDLISTVEAQKGDQGAPGERGERGEKGEKGDPGDRGPKGDKGDKGDRGETGPQGVPGPAGEQGPRGPEGPTGPIGPKGRDGKDGTDGRPGRIPRHKIQNGAIAFEIRPGEYGEWVRFTQTNQYYSGGRGLSWIDYATGFSATPTLLQTIADGDVYEYTYTNGTLYRLVPSGSEIDSFYSTFSGGVLSDLVASKQIEI